MRKGVRLGKVAIAAAALTTLAGCLGGSGSYTFRGPDRYYTAVEHGRRVVLGRVLIGRLNSYGYRLLELCDRSSPATPSVEDGLECLPRSGRPTIAAMRRIESEFPIYRTDDRLTDRMAGSNAEMAPGRPCRVLGSEPAILAFAPDVRPVVNELAFERAGTATRPTVTASGAVKAALGPEPMVPTWIAADEPCDGLVGSVAIFPPWWPVVPPQTADVGYFAGDAVLIVEFKRPTSLRALLDAESLTEMIDGLAGDRITVPVRDAFAKPWRGRSAMPSRAN